MWLIGGALSITEIPRNQLLGDGLFGFGMEYFGPWFANKFQATGLTSNVFLTIGVLLAGVIIISVKRDQVAPRYRDYSDLLPLQARAPSAKLAQSTVSIYLVPRQGRPLQTWKSFLRNHVEEIASIDLFIFPTIVIRQLFVFLVLGHRRRQLLWFAVTQNPTAEWLARQITEAFPWDTAPKYLILEAARSRLGCEQWASGTGAPRSARPGKTAVLNA